MDYTKLLFAAEVRKLAMEKLERAVDKAKREHGDDRNGYDEWRAKQDFGAYIKDAFEDIAVVATTIDLIDETERQANLTAYLNSPD